MSKERHDNGRGIGNWIRRHEWIGIAAAFGAVAVAAVAKSRKEAQTAVVGGDKVLFDRLQDAPQYPERTSARPERRGIQVDTVRLTEELPLFDTKRADGKVIIVTTGQRIFDDHLNRTAGMPALGYRIKEGDWKFVAMPHDNDSPFEPEEVPGSEDPLRIAKYRAGLILENGVTEVAWGSLSVDDAEAGTQVFEPSHTDFAQIYDDYKTAGDRFPATPIVQVPVDQSGSSS
ncbi:MAG: hypothetical protein ABWX94_03030 [Candidatus Saccharimonadales bacterium]